MFVCFFSCYLTKTPTSAAGHFTVIQQFRSVHIISVIVLIVDTMRKSQKFRVDTNYKQYFLSLTHTHSDAVVHLKQTADEYCSFLSHISLLPALFQPFSPSPPLLLLSLHLFTSSGIHIDSLLFF